MKKTSTVMLILVLFIALEVALIAPTKAQNVPVRFVINSDGSVSPQTALISQTGNNYIVTSDFNNDGIDVQKSDILLNGNQHKISNILVESVNNVTILNFDISVPTDANPRLSVNGDGIDIQSSSGVSVENCLITGGVGTLLFQSSGVWVSNSNSITLEGNDIKGASCAIELLGSQNNIIEGNTLSAKSTLTWSHLTGVLMVGLSYGEANNGVYVSDSLNNLIYNNTFLKTDVLVSEGSTVSWESGKIGNYWADYSTKYPNATENGNSGIGNTPYAIDQNNVDHYPLMLKGNNYPVPTQTPNPTPMPTLTPAVPEFSWLILLPLSIFLLSIAVTVRLRKTWKIIQN
jgi:parallel beta-helix repeat protein